MPSIRWLHLTDFHQGLTSQQWLWPTVREQFLEDVGRLIDQTGAIDLVLFSGDLVQSGKATEYERFDENMERLLGFIRDRSGQEPALLAVPGNHDLERPNPRLAQVKLLRFWDTDAEIRDELFSDLSGDLRKTIEKAFGAYSAWWNRRVTRLPAHVRIRPANQEALPGDFAATVQKGDLKLAIVGMNSAFLQLSGDNYEGKLAVHPRQFHGACGGDATDFLREHHAALLMTHHPRPWLSRTAQGDWQRDVYSGRPYIIAHVCGHMHVPAASSVRLGGGPADATMQGASLFGLEKFLGPTGDEFERIHGYSLCALEAKGADAQLSVWPRTLLRRQAGYWKMGADQSYDLTDDGAFRHGVRLNPSALPLAVSSAVKGPLAPSGAAAGSSVSSMPVSSTAAAGPPAGVVVTTTANLRHTLERVIRTDSDLEALCIDYFPDVSRRFSGGMDRTAKINLLLTMKDPDEILQSLMSLFPKGFPLA